MRCRWGLVIQQALQTRAHYWQTPLGTRCLCPRIRYDFLPWRLGTHPLEGKGGAAGC